MQRQHLCIPFAAAVLVCACAGTAQAAPFAITAIPGVGVVQDSGFPEIPNGQYYTVTFVFDNGGSTAIDQVWTSQHLVCAIWRMNAGSVVFAQNLTATPALAAGFVKTNSAGSMTEMYARVQSNDGVPPGSYTASGVALGTVRWWANNVNEVFSSEANNVARIFNDQAGGLRMDATFWTNPQSFNGECAAPAPPPVPTAVPTLAPWGLATLAGGLAGLAAWRRRTRADT
jgi:hypothetical protein